jgi:hypothetical protein
MASRIVVTLTAADLERERPNLERGSVVAAGAGGLPIGALCEVELAFPSGGRMTVPARAVMATGGGTVFAFDAWDREALRRLLAGPATARAPVAEPGPDVPPAAGAGATGAEDEAEEPPSATVQERLRGLPVAEQLRVAREGSLQERVALERLYGKVVWETILRNSRVTVPEVARLAKMGTLPRTLVELIVSNAAWLKVPQIRRALLTNPKLTQEMVQRVLALLPREELKQVPQASAYPPAVRMAAKALLKR